MLSQGRGSPDRWLRLENLSMKNTRNRRSNAATVVHFCALLTLACGDTQATTTEDPGAVAVQWVESGATLLDVRTPGEFASGHVRGAINIPVQDLAQRVDEIPAGRVVVYCQSGRRSASATRTLRATQREVLDLGSIGIWPRREDVAR